MILTFSKDKFIDRIKSGVKIHTIRADKHNRWKKGMKIHFWRGNPRNVKNNPYQFGEGVCTEVARIFVNPIKNYIVIGEYRCKNQESLDEIARNDGFDDWNDMKTWFTEPFPGRIIYWNLT